MLSRWSGQLRFNKCWIFVATAFQCWSCSQALLMFHLLVESWFKCLLFWCIGELEVLHIDWITWAASWQNQQNQCAPREDSDQPGRCPGWSESLLGAHSFCWFCHVMAHMYVSETKKNQGRGLCSHKMGFSPLTVVYYWLSRMVLLLWLVLLSLSTFCLPLLVHSVWESLAPGGHLLRKCCPPCFLLVNRYLSNLAKASIYLSVAELSNMGNYIQDKATL